MPAAMIKIKLNSLIALELWGETTLPSNLNWVSTIRKSSTISHTMHVCNHRDDQQSRVIPATGLCLLQVPNFLDVE